METTVEEIEEVFKESLKQIATRKLRIHLGADDWTVICGTWRYKNCPFRLVQGRHWICLALRGTYRGCLLYNMEEKKIDIKKWL